MSYAHGPVTSIAYPAADVYPLLALPTNFHSSVRFGMAGMFDSNDASGTSAGHQRGHSQTRERQPRDRKLLVKYDVSYADAKVHADVCMPAAIEHTAALLQYFQDYVDTLVMKKPTVEEAQ